MSDAVLMMDEEKTPDGSVISSLGGEGVSLDPSVPVGITIAYKRQISGFHETMIPRATPPRRMLHNDDDDDDDSPFESKGKKKTKNRSFQVFLECGIIYAICTILPTLIGFFYDGYAFWKYQRATVPQQVDSSLLTYYFGQYIPNEWLNYDYSYWCSTSSSSSWSTMTYLISQTGMCSLTSSRSSAHPSVISDDVAAWSDTFTVSVFALLLAAIRIAIVQATVPADEETSALEAMISCKSAHLLSSDYVVTPVATPRSSRRRVLTGIDTASISLPDLQGSAVTDPTATTTTLLYADAGCTTPEREPVSAQTLGTGAPTKQRSSAAPRYATALFRLCYSAAAAAMALVFFRSADFWPWFVGGHGSTDQCWDLSGGLAVGMDSDFDQRNAALKQYFLWQASYHYHSGVFHILSMLTMLIHSSKHAPHRFLSIQKGTYVRRLLQHGMAIVLIGVAYLFSSLRRLCAVGLFAFDVSSCFLHLLQVCINAPQQSRWRKSRRGVAMVFWGMVIPSFVVTRFYIWPTLWYSASFESTPWLQQLEKTLWTGSAALLRTLVHALMGMIEILSVVYFRRLLHHPHLHRVLRQEHNDSIARQLFASKQE